MSQDIRLGESTEECVTRRRNQEGFTGKGLGDKEALRKENKFAGATR